MPTYIVKDKSGAVHEVDFANPPSEADIDEAVASINPPERIGVTEDMLAQARGAANTVGSVLQYAGQLGNYPPGAIPMALAAAGVIKPDATESPLYRAGAGIKEFAEKAFPRPKEQDLLNIANESVGQMGPVLAATPVASPAIMGAVVQGTTLATESMDAYEREVERQKQAGEPIDYAKAAIKGNVYGAAASAIEFKYGTGRIVDKVRQVFSGTKSLSPVKDLVLGRIKDVGLGYSEEAAQRAIQDLIVDGKLDWNAINLEGGVGAIVQGLMGLPAPAISVLADKLSSSKAPESSKAAAVNLQSEGLPATSEAVLNHGEEIESLVSTPLTSEEAGLGGQNAVQEQEANAVGVRNAPAMGEAVGEGNQVTQEAANAGQEGQVAPTISEQQGAVTEAVPGGQPQTQGSNEAQRQGQVEEVLTREPARLNRDSGVAPQAPTSQDVVEAYRSPDEAVDEILAHLGVKTAPESMLFTHDPSLPFAAKIDRETSVVTINTAQIKRGNAVRVVMEEGLHGVWDSPEVQDAWKAWRASVTPADIRSEMARRENLDTDPKVLAEEAAIQRLLDNRPKDKGDLRKLVDSIINAIRKTLGWNIPNTDASRKQLLEAAKAYLVSGRSGQGIRFAAPEASKVTLNQLANDIGEDKLKFLIDEWSYGDAELSEDGKHILESIDTRGTGTRYRKTKVKPDEFIKWYNENKTRFAAPEINPSQGIFKGDYLTEPRQVSSQEADRFLAGFPDRNAALDRLADPTTPILPGARQVAIGKLAVESANALAQTDDPAEKFRLQKLLVRIADIGQTTGTKNAQSLNARKQMIEIMEPQMLLLTALGLINREQEEKIDPAIKPIETATAINEGIKKAEKKASDTLAGSLEGASEEAEVSKEDRTAQRVVDNLAQSQSDTPQLGGIPKTNEVLAAISRQIKAGLPSDVFIKTLVDLGVNEDLAKTLSPIVAREREIRQKIIDSGGTQKAVAAIVNRYAQTQTDTPQASREQKKNAVLELFNGQLGETPLSEQTFTERATALGLSEQDSALLFRIAEREVSIRETGRKVKEQQAREKKRAELVKDPAKVGRLLKKAATSEKVDWNDMFQLSGETQKAKQRELFDKIRNNPALAGLTPEEALELSNSLFSAWERERMRVFRSEFGTLVQLPTVDPEAKVKLSDSIPKLLRYINLGLLDAQAVRNAVAERYGIASMDDPMVKQLQDLSVKAQELPPGKRRNKVLGEMLNLINDNAKISHSKVIADYWYANVLFRTGTLINILFGSLGTGMTYNMLQAMDLAVRGRPGDSVRAMRLFYGSLRYAALVAKHIIETGDTSVLPDFEKDIQSGLSLAKDRSANFDTLESAHRRFLKDPRNNIGLGMLGTFRLTKRLLIAMDYMGAIGTRDASALYTAIVRGDQKSYDALKKKFDKRELENARKRAIAELGADASKLDILSRTKEIMEEGIDSDISEAATRIARRAAANAEPTGFAGFLYRTIKGWPFFMKSLFSLQFARAAANMVNNAEDFIPGWGAVRALQGKAGPEHPLGLDLPVEQQRMIMMAQAVSFAIGTGLANYFLGGGDDKEWDISGSWRNVSPSRAAELRGALNEGPYEITHKPTGFKLNYKQLPFASVLSMIGYARDQQRFNADKWDKEGWIRKFMESWFFGGWGVIKDLSTLTSLSQLFNLQAGNTDDFASLNDWFTRNWGRTLSGFIPYGSALHEVDQFMDDNRYRPEKDDVLGQWMRNVPFLRRYVGEGPDINQLGEEVKVPKPGFRTYMRVKEKGNDRVDEVLNHMILNGVWLPTAGGTRDIIDPETSEKREMNETEKRAYVIRTGTLWKQAIESNHDALLDMDQKQLLAWVKLMNQGKYKIAWQGRMAAVQAAQEKK